MKIRITGKKQLKSYDPGGGIPKINFPMPAVGAEPKPEEAPEGYFNQEPFKQKSWSEQLQASGIGPKQEVGPKLNMNVTPQMSGWDQLANKTAKISDSLMDQTFGNPFSLYNMAGFASNIVDGINNRRDRKRAEARENNFYSTMGMYSEQDPGILSRGIRAVSGTQRNKDLPDSISGYHSWQGMTQMYNSPFKAELGLTVDSILGAPAPMSEFVPSVGPIPLPSINTGAGPIPPPSRDPLIFDGGYSSDSFREMIADRESRGRGGYKALPKDKNGNLVSSAAGKYQFLWSQHSPWITKITGVGSKEEFLNNPQAQEKAFDYWEANTLTPAAYKIKNELGVQDSLEKIKMKVHFAGAKGAYDYYAYGKETVDAFKTRTSTYAEGGQTNNNQAMRIRITGVPNMKTMAYGGQTNYGLDLGQRKVYADMPKDYTESISNIVTEKSEDEMQDGEYPVIMAEDKETLVADIDGDGELEFQKISGDPHSAASGGTKLTNLQLNPDPEKNGEGAFIFSHKLKEKDQEVLKQFGISSNKRGGVSYADMSTKFDTTEEKKVLDDRNADPLTKHTMELRKEIKKGMLQKLAERQEQIKGFPQGNPDLNKSLATMARGGMLFDYMDVGGGKDKNIQKDPELSQYRKRTPFMNTQRELADFDSVDAVTDYYRRRGYTGPAEIGAWQKWIANNQDPSIRQELIKYLRSVPLTNKGREMFGQDADKSKLSDAQLLDQFQDGKWDFRAPRMFQLEGPIRVPREPKNTHPEFRPITLPPPKLTPPGTIPPPGKTPPPTKTPPPGTLPYNAIQKANTLWAASRPVKGYYDRPFNANITGAQAMFDEANYDPLLSANATRMDFMNQFGNAQASRASGTYNPQLNEGLINETDRVRRNNLQIGNQTLSTSNQLFNQDAMMRAREADQVRENNIRTREQLDIAKNLKYNDVMKNYGKMVSDHITMQKYNLMNPQFAVTGPLWNKFMFAKPRPLGAAGPATSSPFMSKDEFFKSNKGFAAAYNSSDPRLQMQADQAYQQYLNSQRSMLMRSGSNMQANMTSPFYMGAMGYSGYGSDPYGE